MYVCIIINNIFIVYDKGWDWVVYLKSVENVITLGKLIGLLFLFLLSIFLLKTKRNYLARPVMGTIFLVYIYIYRDSLLNRPESVSLATLSRQLLYVCRFCPLTLSNSYNP